MIQLIFFLVLPPTCKTIKGPHRIECLRTLWKEGGCLSEGLKNPDNLNNDDYKRFNSLNILLAISLYF